MILDRARMRRGERHLQQQASSLCVDVRDRFPIVAFALAAGGTVGAREEGAREDGADRVEAGAAVAAAAVAGASAQAGMDVEVAASVGGAGGSGSADSNEPGESALLAQLRQGRAEADAQPALLRRAPRVATPRVRTINARVPVGGDKYLSSPPQARIALLQWHPLYPLLAVGTEHGLVHTRWMYEDVYLVPS